MFINKLKIKKGFSILEVLIAVSLVTVGMVGVMSLIIQNNRVNNINKNKFIAVMLAQEGLELYRNKRDSDWKEGITPTDFALPVGKTTYRIYKLANHTVVLDTSNLTNPLRIDNNGAYQYTVGTFTPFVRKIEVISSDLNGDLSPDQLNIISKVEWTDSGKNSSYFTETYLYNWK